MKDGSVGWVFGEYIATRYEMEIIAIAHSYKKTLYPEKDGLRGNPDLYEYCGIFYENGEWVVYFNYVIDHRKGECNTLAIFISNDKKILRIGCYS